MGMESEEGIERKLEEKRLAAVMKRGKRTRSFFFFFFFLAIRALWAAVHIVLHTVTEHGSSGYPAAAEWPSFQVKSAAGSAAARGPSVVRVTLVCVESVCVCKGRDEKLGTVGRLSSGRRGRAGSASPVGGGTQCISQSGPS
jgi:hypothetical protein